MRLNYQIRLGLGVTLLALCVSAAHAAGPDPLPLIDAVRRGDSKAMAALVARKAEINRRQPDGTSALHWAAHRQDLAAVELLLRHKADPNAANDYGITPLSLAAVTGSEGVGAALLASGADPNLAKPNGETPLMTAARTGSPALVKLLLAHGSKVESQEVTHGQTALMWALSEGHFEAAQVLVERGADVRKGSNSGFTPLMFAARTGDAKASRLLLSRGADVNAVAEDGSTALLVAVARGHVDLAKMFLDEGADPNINKAGYTPLHWAVAKWETMSTLGYTWPEGRDGDEWKVMEGVPAQRKVQLVEALLDHGADVNAVSTKDPPRYGVYRYYGRTVGATPLVYAAMADDAPMMRLLLARGANPVVATKDGVTPLHAAAGYGRGATWREVSVTEEMAIEAVQLALSVGNDINAADSIGETSVHHATSANLPGVVRLLAAKGAKLNVKNKYGATPLDSALGQNLPPGTAIVEERPVVAGVLRELGATGDERRLGFAIDGSKAP